MVLVANEFIALGEKDCQSTLEELCVWNNKNEGSAKWDFRINDRLVLLMRVLYVSDVADPIPIPALGAPEFPITKADWQEWPYFPIEFSDGVPLLLPSEYVIAGSPVRAGKYLEFCEGKGWIRRTKLHVPTDQDLRSAIEHLLATRRWKGTNWPMVETDFGPGATEGHPASVSSEIFARDYLYKQCGIANPRRTN
jgi:hypothetical protein